MSASPSDPLRHCVAQLARLPGVGEKTATRFAYWLLQQPPEVAREIGQALQQLRDSMTRCGICCNSSPTDPCGTCADQRRDAGLVCVVEHPQDVLAVEACGEFRGRYHVLHGAISPLDGIGPDELRVRELLARVPSLREVVIATDSDVEGDATALYLARLLKPAGVKVTRLAHGIAVGTEIVYADRGSVARALENRREMP